MLFFLLLYNKIFIGDIIVDINTVLSNSKNIYYGHGTGTDDKMIIALIMNNGLRCSHGSLYYTSEILGIGSQIGSETKEMLKNWAHKNSKIIIIVSLPMKYRILDNAGIGTFNLGDAAYYYLPDSDKQSKYGLTNSSYVMPEFVIGYYDANNDEFTFNRKYYEFLSEDEQLALFNKVKQNYFSIIEDSCGIDLYKEIMEELKDSGWRFALTDDELLFFSQSNDDKTK